MLDETYDQAVEAIDTKPDDTLAFEALKLHLSNIQENGLVGAAFRMAELIGGACLGHLHSDRQHNDNEARLGDQHTDARHTHDDDKRKKKSKKKKPAVLSTPRSNRPEKVSKQKRAKNGPGRRGKTPDKSTAKSRAKAA